jgi:hypothetical protein
MTTPDLSPIQLDDGSLLVPRAMLEALGDEYDARGGLTVSRAQVLVEKWEKESGAHK